LSDEADHNPRYFVRAERVEVRGDGIEQALCPQWCSESAPAPPRAIIDPAKAAYPERDTAYRIRSSLLPFE
jgi:hypothetical protein